MIGGNMPRDERSSKERTQTLAIPPALGICEDCLQNHLMRAAIGNMLVVYCGHNQAGAVMPVKNGQPLGVWRIFTPISIELFSTCVVDAALPVATGPVLEN
jgi:hypothetical protein